MSDIFDFIDQMDEPSKEKPLFDFKEQLAVGDAGEQDFVKSYVNLAPKKSDDLAFDFVLKTGEKVELKTDSYSMSDTPNFFMETLGDIKSGKLGGPWRADKDGVDFFVYYFVKNKTFFWFNSRRLREALDQLIGNKEYKIKSIKNKGWTAFGYAIPRHEVKNVLLHEDYCP